MTGSDVGAGGVNVPAELQRASPIVALVFGTRVLDRCVIAIDGRLINLRYVH